MWRLTVECCGPKTYIVRCGFRHGCFPESARTIDPDAERLALAKRQAEAPIDLGLGPLQEGFEVVLVRLDEGGGRGNGQQQPREFASSCLNGLGGDPPICVRCRKHGAAPISFFATPAS